VFCPLCEAEYRAGLTLCPDCHVELVAEIPAPAPAAPDRLPLTSDLVAVYTSPNPIIAQLVTGVLANEGIEYAAHGGYGGAYPVNVGSLSEVTLYVRTADVARARDLIKAAERGDFALED
jgi:hypothetical protein